MNIREIVQPQDLIFDKPKRKVCAYARISSDKDISHMSFTNQVDTYSNQILSNNNWDYVGVFADESKSGTNIKGRPQFNQMLNMARNGMIDLILTKSISRFSRNTVDSLSLLHELKSINVEVFFEKENISSFDPKIEFVISVLSGMAEEEARIVSENVKWSVRKNFAKGNFYFSTQSFLGYDRDIDGNLSINETQAKAVRVIFEMYAEGEKVTDIVDWLQENNIKTVYGKSNWHPDKIKNIIRNEKYCGDALLQKGYRPTFKSKLKVKNEGLLPQYYVENNHPPIISRELYKKANEIRLQRLSKYLPNDTKSYGTKTQYSEFLFCPYCGKNYVHRINKTGTEYSHYMMQCKSNKGKTICESERVSLLVFNEQILLMINEVILNKKELLRKYKSYLNNQPERKKELLRKEKLQQKLIPLMKQFDSLKSSVDFDMIIYKKLKEKITPIKDEITMIDNKLLTQYNIDAQYKELENILVLYNKAVESIDEFPYRDVFSKVIVESKDNVKFLIGNRKDFINFNKKRRMFNKKTYYRVRKRTYESQCGIYFY